MGIQLMIVEWVAASERHGHFSSFHRMAVQAAIKSNLRFVSVALIGKSEHEKLLHLKELIELHKPSHIYFEWVHDFENLLLTVDNLVRENSATWTSTGSLGRAFRYQLHDLDLKAKNLFLLGRLALCYKFQTFLGLSIFDEFLVLKYEKKFPWLKGLPDAEDWVLAPSCEFCLSTFNSTKPIIGIAGSLRGYRGSEKLVEIWNKSREFRLGLFGKYFPETHSLKINKLVLKQLKGSEHLLVLNEIEDSRLLNHYISHLDALYIDTERYPEPSGIAFRALRQGKTLIIEDADSYLNDLSESQGQIILSDILRRPRAELSDKISKVSVSKVPFNFPDESDVLRAYTELWGVL